MLEALSDASPELFLSTLAASHLRRYGGQYKERFWVRREWDGVDISYGATTEYFDGRRGGWDAAWKRNITGDLGLIEAKVCYTHHYAGKIVELAGQLKARRLRYEGHGDYHGLVWLFEHGGCEGIEGLKTAVEREAQASGLELVASHAPDTAPNDLGMLWPSMDGKPYKCGMALMWLTIAS